MQLIVDNEHLGHSEVAWNLSGQLANLAPLELGRPRRMIIVAPHPDDEVLGAGGLIQHALSQDIPLEIIAVTDGEGSHPKSKVAPELDLAGRRVRESKEALRRLGWDAPVITRLHMPDSNVAACGRQLEEALTSVLRPEDLCVAPWRHDGHPDHDVCGESALHSSQIAGAKTLGYPVWAWHWADPGGSDIPWSLCRRFELGRRARARKRWAIGAFRSQIEAIGPDAADAPVLSPPILRRFWRPYEVYIDETLATT